MVNRVRLPRSVVHVLLVLAIVAGQIGPLPGGGVSQVAAAPQTAAPALASDAAGGTAAQAQQTEVQPAPRAGLAMPASPAAPTSEASSASLSGDVALLTPSYSPQASPLAQTPTYQDVVLADTPLGYWRLGETSGTTAYDASGNAYHGTIAAGVTLGLAGAIAGDPDTAMGFDALSERVVVPPGFSDFSNGLTVEAWVYPTASSNYMGRFLDFGTGGGYNNIILLRGNGSDLAFRLCNNTAACSTPAAAYNVLQVNTWQHVAATVTATGYVTVYYNGLRVAAGQSTVLPTNVVRTANYLAYGRDSLDRPYTGYLDEVAIYNAPLTIERIKAHYAAGSPPPPPPPPPSAYQSAVMADNPMGYWRLGEPSGGVAYDMTGHENNGTITVGVTQGLTGAIAGDPDTAMGFDALHERVVMPPGFSDFSNGLTVEAWVYPTASSNRQARFVDFGTGGGKDNIILLRGEGNDLAFRLCNSSGGCSTPATAYSVLQINSWQHVAATVSATGYVTLYYNGLRVAAGQSSVLPTNVTRTANYLAYGTDSTYRQYVGYLDEVAIYNAPLSIERLKAHYAAGSTPPPPPPPASAYQSAVMADAPLGYWRLGEASGGVAYDMTGHENNGTITVGVTQGLTGAIAGDPDTAMGFDALHERVVMPPGFSDFSNGLTVEAWVYPTASSNRQARFVDFGTGGSKDNIILLRGEGNDLAFRLCNSSGGCSTPATAYSVLQINSWQHVAATVSATGYVTLYYNGLQVAAGQSSVLPTNVTRTANYLAYGTDSTYRQYVGYLDEVAIYNAPLSIERIFAHFRAAGYSTALDSWGQPLQSLGLGYRGTSQDPVDTGSGVYTYSHTDLGIAGRGPSPAFSRSYNFMAATVGPLGPGWTHNYHSRIVHNAQGQLAVVSPGGRYDVYTPTGGGQFDAPQGVDSELSQDLTSGNYVLRHKDGGSWTYDELGRLITIADRYGNESALAYNVDGQLASVSDPAGRGSLTFAYDATSGRLTSVSDWFVPARTVQFEYDANGRLWKVTDREGETTTYGYDGTSSRLTTITDARGHIAVTNTYDAEGRVATQTDARGLVTGQQTTFQYVTNPDGTKTTTVTYPATSLDPNWNLVEIDTYDTQGRLVSRVSKPTANSADDVTVSRTYDANSFLASLTDGRGNTANYCYDVAYDGTAIAGSHGNLTRVIGPPPTAGANRPVTLYQYDDQNNLTQTVPPKGVNSGTTVTCATDLSGALNSQYATDMAYDAATQTKLESVTSRYTDPDLGAQTGVTKFEYGDASNPGLVTKVIPPRGNTGGTPDYTYATTNAYYTSGSKAGLLQSVTDPLGNVTTYDYDAVGRRTGMVDPNGNVQGGVPADHTWSYEYDQEDRLRFSRAPAPSPGGSALVSEYRYDEVGNRVVVIDPNGQVTRYVYDERDGLKEVHESPSAWTDPAATPNPEYLTEYEYDHAGNLSRVTRAKGDGTYERATDYAYDGLNRVRQESQYPSWPSTSGSLVTEYTYDLNGNRATLLDPLGQTTTYGYDALDRLTGITYSDGQTPDVTYAYDADGNRTSMADGTGTTTYTYDEANRLLSVTSPGSEVVGYRYDLDGNRTKVIYPDATVVTYTFDKASRLGSLLDWASRSTGYEYNPDGSLKTVTNFNGTTAEYAYDNALRLTDLWNKHNTETISRHTYTVDAAGNRTQVDEVLAQVGGGSLNQTLTYGYDKLYRLTTVDGPGDDSTYEYDPVGNRLTITRGGVTNYTYDPADRITAAGAVSYTVNANGNLVARGADTFAYDQANRLKTASVGGVASTYVYDGDGKRASKTVDANTTHYVYDANRSLPVVLGDGERKYVWGIGLAYAVGTDSSILVYHTDGLGSVRAVMDASGELVQTYQTDEFGVPTESHGALSQPFGYTGEQQDPETGFVYLRARYYEPVGGRFINKDLISGIYDEPDTLNRYLYVGNNPVLFADPSGLVVPPRSAKARALLGDPDPTTLVNPFGIAPALGSLAIRQVGHHIIPRAILKQIPSNVYNAVRGAKGNPNIWKIDEDLHKALHAHGSSGGAYNQAWQAVIDRLDQAGQLTAEKVLQWRDTMVEVFGLGRWRP